MTQVAESATASSIPRRPIARTCSSLDHARYPGFRRPTRRRPSPAKNGPTGCPRRRRDGVDRDARFAINQTPTCSSPSRRRTRRSSTRWRPAAGRVHIATGSATVECSPPATPPRSSSAKVTITTGAAPAFVLLRSRMTDRVSAIDRPSPRSSRAGDVLAGDQPTSRPPRHRNQRAGGVVHARRPPRATRLPGPAPRHGRIAGRRCAASPCEASARTRSARVSRPTSGSSAPPRDGEVLLRRPAVPPRPPGARRRRQAPEATDHPRRDGQPVQERRLLDRLRLGARPARRRGRRGSASASRRARRTPSRPRSPDR